MSTRTIQSVFGDALAPDPALALKPVPIPIRTKAGPLHRLEFVIEFVGPRTIPAQMAATVLQSDWFAALGNPKPWAMGSGDTEWRQLTALAAGSYDSLALSWPLLGTQGEISAGSAQHLLQAAEALAQHLNRRALPMPVPEDVPKAIQQLKQVEDNFDAGLTLMVLAGTREVSEYELWVWCAQLGLTYNPTGSWDWRVPASTLPLFSITPLGAAETFNLEAAERGDKHEGVLLGFNLPRNPEPLAALQGMFQTADTLALKMSGQVFDENGQPLSANGRMDLQATLTQVVQAVSNLGFAPGSPEALALFPT